jgi:hypothetical protein
VPLIASDSRVVRANISLDKGTLDAIDAAAPARDLTRSAFLAEAARRESGGIDRTVLRPKRLLESGTLITKP